MSELSAAGQGAHAEHAGHGGHGEVTSLGVDSRKLGMWTFIGSETLFFTALIMVYLINNRVNEGLRGTADFQDPKHFLDITLTSVLAAILLASSLTMVLALSAIRRNDMAKFRVWLLSTVALGIAFVGGQAYEFYHLYHEGLTLSSSMFGTSFFVLTGFHGTHVALGVVWLLAVFLRSQRGRYSASNDMDVELVGLYWHFVDLVWVAIFTLIYLI